MTTMTQICESDLSNGRQNVNKRNLELIIDDIQHGSKFENRTVNNVQDVDGKKFEYHQNNVHNDE